MLLAGLRVKQKTMPSSYFYFPGFNNLAMNTSGSPVNKTRLSGIDLEFVHTIEMSVSVQKKGKGRVKIGGPGRQ